MPALSLLAKSTSGAAEIIANATKEGCAALAVVSSHGGEHDVYIQALLLLVMITVCINLHRWLHHINFKHLGETAIYLIMGFVVSAGWTSLSYDPGNSAIQLNSHFFSLVLLPPIIFEGGFSLQRKSFFQNIIPILGLSLIGAFYSTFVTSALMYGFSRLIGETGWTVIESLVFGALISSTDPVTVLSLLPATVDKRMYMLIFGESALNDAVSIILYRFFTSLQTEADHFGVSTFFISVLASFGVFLGSFIVGVAVALIFGTCLFVVSSCRILIVFHGVKLSFYYSYYN